MCGFFATPQRGHTLRDGTVIFIFAERRLRLFILEVFFLGTATIFSVELGATWMCAQLAV
jgi:hypothetical protein